VLVAGETVTLPVEPTAPMPLSIVIDVALDTLQVRVVEPPNMILVELAVKEFITGRVPVAGGGGAAPEIIT
jgi:hypothetical protein